MRRVTKRVSELIPGTTWMNMLLGESQSGNELLLTNENNDQPPVKKLCTSNNTFTSTNNRTYVDTNSPRNSVDNHKNSSKIKFNCNINYLFSSSILVILNLFIVPTLNMNPQFYYDS